MNWKISKLWRDANVMLEELSKNSVVNIGEQSVIEPIAALQGVRLPSDLVMRYEDLTGEQDEKGLQFTYKTRRGRTKIYGGKCVENICQAVARCIIADQMLLISKRYAPVLTVHDSIIACVPEEEVSEAHLPPRYTVANV